MRLTKCLSLVETFYVINLKAEFVINYLDSSIRMKKHSNGISKEVFWNLYYH